MKKKGQDQAKHEYVDKKVRVVFGADEGRLAEEYDRIAAGLDGSDEPAAPEGEFEKILKRVEKAVEKNQNQRDDKSMPSYYNEQ